MSVVLDEGCIGRKYRKLFLVMNVIGGKYVNLQMCGLENLFPCHQSLGFTLITYIFMHDFRNCCSKVLLVIKVVD